MLPNCSDVAMIIFPCVFWIYQTWKYEVITEEWSCSESNQKVAASQSVDKTSPSCQPCHYGTNKYLQISHIEQ